jgi:hypothetical protein
MRTFNTTKMLRKKANRGHASRCRKIAVASGSSRRWAEYSSAHRVLLWFCPIGDASAGACVIKRVHRGTPPPTTARRAWGPFFLLSIHKPHLSWFHALDTANELQPRERGDLRCWIAHCLSSVLSMRVS